MQLRILLGEALSGLVEIELVGDAKCTCYLSIRGYTELLARDSHCA